MAAILLKKCIIVSKLVNFKTSENELRAFNFIDFVISLNCYFGTLTHFDCQINNTRDIKELPSRCRINLS